MPDTLDLAERAALALNALTRAADVDHYYESYQCAHFDHNPPYVSYRWEGPCLAKPIQAIPMMRVMSGSDQLAGIEAKMLESMFKDIGEDGLWWQKIEGRPWRAETFKTDQVWPVAQGRLMEALMEWYQLDQNPRWLDIVGNMARGLGKIALRKEDRSWFAGDIYTRDGWGKDNTVSAEVMIKSQFGGFTEQEPAGVNGYNLGLPLRGLVAWHKVSGDRDALELADRLARFYMKPAMWPRPDGPSMVVSHEHGHLRSHFHTATFGVMGLLQYAIYRNDARLIRFCADFYEFMRCFGISRIGFFPAVIGPLEEVQKHALAYGNSKAQCDETCATSDMLWLAATLSDAGVGDYWDDVDQYVRNQLTEHQILRRDLVEEMVAVGPRHTVNPPIESDESVIDRIMGTFACGGDPTILYGWEVPCCLCNGSVGLYRAWEAILRETNGVAQVNLLLNRASERLDVASCLPYEGKVVLKNKTARKVNLRLPLWVDRKQVQCRINGQAIPIEWVNRRLVIGGLANGDEIAVEFPMKETTEKWTEPTSETTYTCRFRGNTLMDISPRAERPAYPKMSSDDGGAFPVVKGYPIYLRNHLKGDKAPMKKTQRFVPDKIVVHW